MRSELELSSNNLCGEEYDAQISAIYSSKKRHSQFRNSPAVRLKARRVRITPDSITSITFIAPEVRCKASDELMLKCSGVGR